MKTRHRSPFAGSITGAFTLIELLTVIAIIGILAAILIPVVGSVRDSARVAACASQLRDLGLAVHLYAEDNEDRIPANIHNDNPTSVNGSLGSRTIGLLLSYDRGGQNQSVTAGYVDHARQLFCPYSRPEYFAESGVTDPETVDANNRIGRVGYFWDYRVPDTAAAGGIGGMHRENYKTTVDNPNRPFMWDFLLPGTAGLGPIFTYNPHEKRTNVWHIGGHLTQHNLEEIRENAVGFNDVYDFFTFGDWNGLR